MRSRTRPAAARCPLETAGRTPGSSGAFVMPAIRREYLEKTPAHDEGLEAGRGAGRGSGFPELVGSDQSQRLAGERSERLVGDPVLDQVAVRLEREDLRRRACSRSDDDLRLAVEVHIGRRHRQAAGKLEPELLDEKA